MNKKLKSLLVLTFTASILWTNVAFASVTDQPVSTTISSNSSIKSDNINQAQPINLTPQDIAEGKAKLILADEYCKNKKTAISSNSKTSISQSATGWGGSNYLAVPYRVESPNWCGEASAQEAIFYKLPDYADESQCPLYGMRPITQSNLAMSLGYSSGGGTPYGSLWTSTLNTFMSANHYSLLYASSFPSDWKSHMENGIIYTVDKGYAVIVDTHMLSTTEGGASTPRVNSAYSYLDSRKRGCYHFIVANGYNTSNGNDLIYITDCNDAPSFPHYYWCSASSLAGVSAQYGIVY